jgi:hypothetical protein
VFDGILNKLTRELLISELDLSEIGFEDERMIELADDCVQY